MKLLIFEKHDKERCSPGSISGSLKTDSSWILYVYPQAGKLYLWCGYNFYSSSFFYVAFFFFFGDSDSGGFSSSSFHTMSLSVIYNYF